MARHTFTQANALYRGKDTAGKTAHIVEGSSPSGGYVLDPLQRGIPAQIPVKQTWSSIPAANGSALDALQSVSATLIGATVTMTGDSTGNPLARQICIDNSAAAGSIRTYRCIGEDIHGATVTSYVSVSGAQTGGAGAGYKFNTAYRVVYEVRSVNGSASAPDVQVGYGDQLGLKYRLSSPTDVISHVEQATPSATSFFDSTARFIAATGTNGTHLATTQAAAGTSDGDARGYIQPTIAADGARVQTLWYYVSDTDNAYGHGSKSST